MTLGNDYVQSTSSGDSLFSDAYDFSTSSAPIKAAESNAATVAVADAEPTFAEESAYRIMRDIKAIDDARESQTAFWSPTTLANSGLLLLNGFLMKGRFGTVSMGTGIGLLISCIARGLKDGADWKAAADDMNSVFDELLERQEQGELKPHDVERFAILMHNLPVDSLKDILDDGQKAKYEELIASVAKKVVLQSFRFKWKPPGV